MKRSHFFRTPRRAALALTALARERPAAAAYVRELFAALLKALPRPGYVPYEHALVSCFLLLPELDAEEREVLLDWKRGLERNDD